MHRVRISGYPPTSVDPQIATVHPAQFTQLIHKRCELRLGFRITHQHADPPHPLGLLRTRRDRPRRSAAESTDEIATPHGPPSTRAAYPYHGRLRCASQQNWTHYFRNGSCVTSIARPHGKA